MIVQQALLRHQRWLGGQRPPGPTGVFDAATATAIVAFQREAAALKTPDGIVSPQSYTMSALARDTIPPLQHRIFLRVCWLHSNDVLTDADYATAARDLQCEVAAIRAVANVEAQNSPWDYEGRPVILFERHKFAFHTGGRFSGTHPDLSQRSSGGHGLPDKQYGKLRHAAMLDEAAALKSASWGLFQILGENHRTAGYPDVAAFVTGMMQSRAHHLRAFVGHVRGYPALHRAIQQKHWAGFALRYNGKDYREGNYDGKMRAAYARLAPRPPGRAVR
jgi:hypothetical protein